MLKTLLAVLVLVVVSGLADARSRPSVDVKKDEAELVRMHMIAREAHFKTDVDLLLRDAPDEFVAVSDGRIYRTSKADERKQFEAYFKDAKYYEWDDIEEPMARISNDGSMAWVITRTRVRRTQPDSTGVEKERRFIYAGIMTYEKRAGRWMRVANVSTFERPN